MDADETLAKEKMTLLRDKTNILIDDIAATNPAFVAFEIQQITKEDESKYIHQGIDFLEVNTISQWHEIYKVLNSYIDFYRDIKLSTQFVKRLPGIVVVTEKQDYFKDLVDSINKTKDEFAAIIRNGRNNKQRHEFIHSLFKGIMTEQVYRKIYYIDEPVTNVWFNWNSRPVPRTMSLSEAVAYLNTKKNDVPIWCDKTEWNAIIEAGINNVNSGQYTAVQKLKEFKAFPTVEFKKQPVDLPVQKVRRNATIPILLFAQDENTLPKLRIRLKCSLAGKANWSSLYRVYPSL